MSCKLILANSNKQGTLETIKNLKSLTFNDEIYYSYLNFNNFSNIQKFIQKFFNSDQRLDILINFGSYCEGFDITEDKYEVNLQWNYLGNVVLSLGLVPILKNTKGSRIINVVSDTGNILSYYMYYSANYSFL
jgi:NAD(P)-dependent dehydrogenase (short-subunit alcohol dehydrogenase family)